MWEFWIDVGGTFTDCIARAPDGKLRTVKVLSSGLTKGRVERIQGDHRFFDAQRRGEPDGFRTGYTLRFLSPAGEILAETTVTASFSDGTLETAAALPADISPGTSCELDGHEEAPLLAMRRVLGLPLSAPLPEVMVKLGTTRGTNALLTRSGARTALITTAGLADVLRIANQNRPRLFDLNIRKPQPLCERVLEIDERLTARGEVLRSPQEEKVRRQLQELKETGVESLALCLLHSFTNAAHEQLVEQWAREAGFTEISTSSRLSPLIKIVSRGDTTTVDAYLNPVLREYVAGIRRALEGKRAGRSGNGAAGAPPPRASSLKIMTSAGGLVEADHFVGKDSILSGPAGGVIGFSRVAQRAGFEKSIGFDMGGTSTDVSRFDGTYETEFETEKAGVRIVSPMLAIETVAAGGGSICGFDGVKLHVGPASAGAKPGPACYGRGGPLTVTDVNLFLGKILPERFPFPLDRRAVQKRLEKLCDEIADSPLGRRYTPAELAQGFVDIANASMVRAIRKISVAKGYDPADYALVTFGGAGGQHACALAAALGMKHILLHPFAGILSAYGIGLADVRRFGERSVLRPYSGETLQQLEPVFAELERETTAQVRSEGVTADNIQPPVRSLDLRYVGTDSALHVPRPENGDYLARFTRLHQQLYGYVHEGRRVEIVAARVEVVGQMPAPEEPAAALQPRAPAPAEVTRTSFGGREYETAVYGRDQLQPGDTLSGPAIVCEPTSTVVIDPGWQGTVREQGELLLQPSTEAAQQKAETAKNAGGAEKVSAGHSSPGDPLAVPERADPVLLEIFNNLFASIAEQMGVTLQRTSFSTNVKERLDFSCAIFSPGGDLVVNAPHIPVHLGAMSETVKRILADNPGMSPGDVFITNDPYRGGSHLPDVTVITPVFEERSLLFLTASRAHHAEIGGIVPGSMPPFSKNLAEEGVLIRNFKYIDRGTVREEELRQLLTSGPYPTRNVHDNLADIAAQVAANNTGVQQLQELVRRYSLPVVQAYMTHIQRAAAEKMRLALRHIPDGRYHFTDHLDEGAPIRVTITIAGDEATVDFTGTAGVLPSNLNANRAIVTAAVLYVFRCLIAEDIPLNSGVLEPVRLVLPECLLNPPEEDDPARCPAVVGGNVETSQRVVDVLLGALQVAAASQGTMNNLTFGDETFGYYETICGGAGATPDDDGADAVHTHMTNTRLTDVEVIERRYPVRIRRFEIRRGSGGAGRHAGGDGVIREIEFLRPLKVSMLSERRGPYPPFGLDGGEAGQLGRNLLFRKGTAEPENLGGKFALDVQPGDVLLIETPGGGGFGTPLSPDDLSKHSSQGTGTIS